MSEPVTFLNAFAHALAVMTLYPEGHPSRESGIDSSYEDLSDLMATGRRPAFTFIEDEVIYGREPLRDLKGWHWGQRLAAAGIQRLEFERHVTRDEFESFLQEILARLALLAIDTSEQRQVRSLGVRFGAVGLQGETDAPPEPVAIATLDIRLDEEAETLRWLQQQSRLRGMIPLIEAETVVRSLAVAMHRDAQVVLPLVQLKEFDQYTTTHSLNVSVLSMGVAETIGCSPAEVRMFGVAGLLHDIGKIRIPSEIINKPGPLDAEERAIIETHTIEGERMLEQVGGLIGHVGELVRSCHERWDGGGYPDGLAGEDIPLIARIVCACDAYSAMTTNRSYRKALGRDEALDELRRCAGTHFDPQVVDAILRVDG